MGKKRREIPRFEKPLIETHCHLDYLKDRPLEETLQKCHDLNIEKIVTIAVEPGNLDKVVELTSSHPKVFGTQGIHPHEAKSWTDAVEQKISTNTSLDKIIAIGEIGLDFYYNNSPRDKQLPVFKKQMEMAAQLNLPVVIHSRDADIETIAILDELAPQLKKKGVIHSFTSGPDLARNALSHGFYLGFNGIITFNSAQNVREIVELCPLENIILETDAPFLTPVPYRGRENAPFYLPFVAEKIAEIKNCSLEEVLEVTYQNSLDLFFT
jgi:TatD DNase family protein